MECYLNQLFYSGTNQAFGHDEENKSWLSSFSHLPKTINLKYLYVLKYIHICPTDNVLKFIEHGNVKPHPSKKDKVLTGKL